ncbi:MAG: hypothetical protein EBT26_11080 [Microbacteriaceae bacterium]|nr:hypothetical protein [Microbacteriaceae bacterium]
MDRELQLKALEEFRDFVIQNAKQNLSTKNVSGKLKNSFKATVKVMPNSMTFMFEMEEYGWYQDKGVSGVKQKYNTPFSYKSKGGKRGLKGMPNPSKLDKWIVRRGLAPRDKGKFTGRKTLQFLIARSIFEKGIKPSLWFTKPFEQGFKGLPDTLIDRYGLESEKLFNQIMKENMKNYGYK